jgi:uncharacterized protein GlcG (DUF336 family)
MHSQLEISDPAMHASATLSPTLSEELPMSLSPAVMPLVAGALVLMSVLPAGGQLPNPYGVSIGLADAKKATAPAIAEAHANNWTMAVAIVDISGLLVYFEKMDGTQNASVSIALEKARTAALFKRPTKAMQDVLAAGGDGLRLLTLPNATLVEGGVPLIMGGKIVGAIGVSGGTSAQDGQVAAKGVAAVQ